MRRTGPRLPLRSLPGFCIALFSATAVYLVFKWATDWDHWLFVPIEYLGPGVFVLALVLLGVSIRKRHKTCIALTAVSVLTWWPNISGLVALNLPHAATKEHDTFTVMSYNVMSFRYRTNSPQDVQANADFILGLGADIQCLQEFKFPTPPGVTPTQEAIAAYFQPRGYNAFVPYPDQIAPALLSRFPITGTGEVYTPRYTGDANKSIYADLATPSGTLRVYSVHLASLNPIFEERNRLINMQAADLPSANLRYFDAKRAQAQHLLTSIRNAPHPVIVCGDFNELPPGYVYQLIRTELRNAFERKGLGLGGTSNKHGLRLARIDHMFTSPSLETLTIAVRSDIDRSDHYPVVASFRMQPVASAAE